MRIKSYITNLIGEQEDFNNPTREGIWKIIFLSSETNIGTDS
jgi:hypothetical protein